MTTPTTTPTTTRRRMEMERSRRMNPQLGKGNTTNYSRITT